MKRTGRAALGRSRRILFAVLCLALAAPPAVAAAEGESTSSPPGCASSAGGGEWRSYGGDLRNTRSQPAEEVIDAENVGSLSADFAFDITEHGGSGVLHGTPIVADGCVYFGTTTGWVFAVNAETGDVAWSTQLEVGTGGLLCTGIVGSTVVSGGKVFAIVSQAADGDEVGPYVVALDQADGSELWRDTLDTTEGVYNCASPVVFDGMVIAAFNGDQTAEMNRGGYVIYDVDGNRLAKRYTIPPEDIDEHKGGGIWSTPAVDTDARYAYAGTSNPDAGTKEHPRTNAILKIDVDPSRDTFGEIVASYKGNPDRYVDLPRPPTCTPDPSVNVFVRSFLCTQMDLDFGASPQLLDGPDGGLRVGALQKAGVYHLADAETMEREWATVVGPPAFYGHIATAATDGESIYVAASHPGQVFGLDADDGGYRWVSPIGDLLHFQGVAYANGLVYTNDAKGFLNVYDAENGVIAAQHHVAGDIGQPVYAEASSGSTVIARNTAYVAASGHLVAYRLSG